ncbi:hypothetical protein FOL47_001105 [Perkinsus chesapeaki]|uniref:Tyr recombinase domain-containing protein n=1 Tax=Perkinsus chesapeaki TaxID=330153 RepID=A0A7J6KUC3_PERCH|nr:hypothetical protein FOL47_001105 [Perkinsus chesapeaki]
MKNGGIREWLAEKKAEKDVIFREYLRTKNLNESPVKGPTVRPDVHIRQLDTPRNLETVRISDQEVETFIHGARAVNTHKQYNSITKGYRDFVATQDPSADCFPIIPSMLVRYAIYLTRKKRAKETILKYIRVLRMVDKSSAGARKWSVSEEELMRLTREAVRRKSPSSRPKQALTLTDQQLRNAALVTPPSGRKSGSTAVLLGVAACLRPGELADLERRDITDDRSNNVLWVNVREGKTDIERWGESVLVACCCTENGKTEVFCPFHRTIELLDEVDVCRKLQTTSIFGCTKEELNKDIKDVLRIVTGSSHRATAHALRKSAAHLMAERGMSPQEIADHGRWKSTTTVLNTYLRQSSSYEDKAKGYASKIFNPAVSTSTSSSTRASCAVTSARHSDRIEPTTISHSRRVRRLTTEAEIMLREMIRNKRQD